MDGLFRANILRVYLQIRMCIDMPLCRSVAIPGERRECVASGYAYNKDIRIIGISVHSDILVIWLVLLYGYAYNTDNPHIGMSLLSDYPY